MFDKFGVKLFSLKQEPITIISGLGLLLTAAGVSESYRKGKSAQRATESEYRIQQRQAEIQRTKEKRVAIAAAHEQQANVIAASIAHGAGAGSSGAAGEVASIGSQVSSNIGFASQEAQLSDQAASFAESANKATSSAATFQQLGGLPGQLGLTPDWKAIGASIKSKSSGI